MSVYPRICGSLEMQLSADGTVWGAWQQAVASVPWMNPPAFVKLRDRAGNTAVISTGPTPPPGWPIRIASATPSYFSLLQSAYETAETDTVIQALATSLTETIVLNRDIPVTVRGGFSDTSYGETSGYSVLSGSILVTAGTASLENFQVNGVVSVETGVIMANNIVIL